MEYSEAEKQMLREVLPGIAVQLRGALANIHGALGRLAPERLRDRDTGTDRSAAILCQSYYKILRVVNNLSDFIFGMIRAVGMILLGWGIVQVGMSIQSHDASQRTQGFLCLFGGLMIAFAKEILTAIGAV